MRTTRSVDATFYAQVEPEWGRSASYDPEPPIRRVRVARITLTRPDRPKPGVVVVKLTLRIPAAAFYPLQPEAVVEIPTELTQPFPVSVVAGDPHAEDGEHGEAPGGPS
jgi:hypothetical protein